MHRAILPLTLAVAAAGVIAGQGCGTPCQSGTSRCADQSTLQFCTNRAGDINPSAGGNFWTESTCAGANAFCVVLSSGAATCAALPDRDPSCATSAGGWVCAGDAGNIPGFCDDGYVQSAPTICSPPTTVCATTGFTSGCVPGPPITEPTDAGPDAADASEDSSAPDATPDAEPDAQPDAAPDGG